MVTTLLIIAAILIGIPIAFMVAWQLLKLFFQTLKIFLSDIKFP
jgi:hypothetical protein